MHNANTIARRRLLAAAAAGAGLVMLRAGTPARAQPKQEKLSAKDDREPEPEREKR